MIIAGPSGVGKTTISGCVAAAFDRSALVRADEFADMVVRGFVDPWRPEAAHQNAMLGAAMASAAAQLAGGGYTTVVDGSVFPDGARGFATICGRHGVTVQYVVLRASLQTCRERVAGRGTPPPDDERFAALHDRYADLGEYEVHVVEARAPIAAVCDTVVSSLGEQRFTVTT